MYLFWLPDMKKKMEEANADLLGIYMGLITPWYENKFAPENVGFPQKAEGVFSHLCDSGTWRWNLILGS